MTNEQKLVEAVAEPGDPVAELVKKHSRAELVNMVKASGGSRGISTWAKADLAREIHARRAAN